jgi:hypothetical protein
MTPMDADLGNRRRFVDELNATGRESVCPSTSIGVALRNLRTNASGAAGHAGCRGAIKTGRLLLAKPDTL